MNRQAIRKLTPVSFTQVRLNDAFWKRRQDINRTVTLPIEYKICKETGRIDAYRLAPNADSLTWKRLWMGDAAKWIEAASYSLAVHPDPELEQRVDEAVESIVAGQKEDGYLYCRPYPPERRWRNLKSDHELYDAGHMMEAAAAYFHATGKRKLLDAMCRNADLMARVFGRGPSTMLRAALSLSKGAKGRMRGYCGHPEVELALVKLYRATGERRYLELAKYFVDERGSKPYYFDLEAQARDEKPGGGYEYCQAHMPVREQRDAEGHAVRALYLFSGMADVAAETGDRSLRNACRRLWRSITRRRMYVTGGVGSSRQGERFTFDYDLPNELGYAETCANIALVFSAHRMLQMEADGEYADVMERALYNSVLSGVGLDGMSFFYANPLTIHPEASKGASGHVASVRQKWFDCSCCPPNAARLLASFGQYVYSQAQGEVYVHLYVGGKAELELEGRKVTIIQKTEYPWGESIALEVRPLESPAELTLALRIPGWCRGARLRVNGKAAKVPSVLDKGYAKIRRRWSEGDQVELVLPMPVERIEAHPNVRMDCGKVALQRGPLVYCLEEVDNGCNLADIELPRTSPLRASFHRHLLGGTMVITGKAYRRASQGWDDRLYRQDQSKRREVRLVAIPYCLWGNRKPGEMLVWVRDYNG